MTEGVIMEFRILGHLEIISSDGDPVRIAKPRVREFLSVLLLRAGRPCSHGMLAEALWGDGNLPREPATAVRVYAYRARRALGRDGERLATLPEAYRIDLGEGELDLHRFYDFSVAGERAMASGRPGQACDAFSRALDLWRDPPLADLPAAPEIEAEVARLLEQRRAAESGLADARLALGHHQQILPDLRKAVTQDPLSERSWAQLMLASYRSRGRAAALAVYSEARGALLAELGVNPGRELQFLLRAVLDEDPDLALQRAAAGPKVQRLCAHGRSGSNAVLIWLVGGRAARTDSAASPAQPSLTQQCPRNASGTRSLRMPRSPLGPHPVGLDCPDLAKCLENGSLPVEPRRQPPPWPRRPPPALGRPPVAAAVRPVVQGVKDITRETSTRQ
jgi:DNA-binding SARP family transcriptional activator